MTDHQFSLEQIVEALDGISNQVLTFSAFADISENIRLTGTSPLAAVSATRFFSTSTLKNPAEAVQQTLFDLHAHILNECGSLFPRIGNTCADESLSKSDVQDYCRFWNRVNSYTDLSMSGGAGGYDRRLVLSRLMPFAISASRPVPMTVESLASCVSWLSKEVDWFTRASSDAAVGDSVKHFKKRLQVLQTGGKVVPPSPKPRTVVEELQYHFDLTQQVTCPCRNCKPSNPSLRANVAKAVVHLNDQEKWTREEIADWLEAQDGLDLRLKG